MPEPQKTVEVNVRAILGFLFLCLFLSSCSTSDAESAGAGEPALSVKVGKSAAAAVEVSTHDLTVAALRQGQTSFKIANDGQDLKIALSQQQVKDVLDGSMVLVSAAGGDLKVSIHMAAAQEEKGW